MIFERGHFNSFRTSKIKKSVISESLDRSRYFTDIQVQSTVKTTVFLLHKHKDLKDVEEAAAVIEMLEKLGAVVYVDSMDDKQPKQTSGETAKRIKNVIKACDKFILLGTNNAIQSHWCNWELGIGDVHKYINNIAILPIKDKNASDAQYKGNEYLQIYPRIDFRDGTTKYVASGKPVQRGYYVCKPRNKNGLTILDPLKDWLKK